MPSPDHKPRPFVPAGVPYLGACLACVVEIKQAPPDKQRERTPENAITMAPTFVPLGPGAMMAVAVPTCWNHVAVAKTGGLIAANGRV